MRYLLISFIFLFLCSCESTHTFRKIIQNNSSHSIQLHYFSSSYDMDTMYFMTSNSSVDIEFFQKLGNKPCVIPSSPCSITENDTLEVFLEDMMFLGDFRNEYNWTEDLGGNKHTIQVCTYVITDGEFE